MRQGLGAFALAAMMAITSFAADASPLMKSPAPSDSFASRISLVHQVLIYAKEGSSKLVDGRWNLSQSEAKLGIQLSADETQQLMACTGQIVCAASGGQLRVSASAISVLRPDLLVTAKHVLFNGRRAVVPFGSCSFRSYSRRHVAIPVVVDKDQRKGYVFNNEDFLVLRLKRALEGCSAFAITGSDTSLREGEQLLSVTGHQIRTMNKLSRREPVVAKGTVRSAFDGFFGGPPFYYTDIDFDIGGSGGAVFALEDGRPISDEEGRLILRGISVAYGMKAKSGKPYSEERNHTIVVGLQAEFRDLVEGKARKPDAMEPAPCPEGGKAKIAVLSDSLAESEALAPSLQQYVCSQDATPGREAGTANAACIALAKELKEVARLKLASSRRAKEKRAFRLRNDTGCPICFTYDRCNDYGCWDEGVRLSGKSALLAGVRERAPSIRNPQFCQTEQASAEARLMAAKEKAEREGAHRLTSEDIRGLSLEQIKELRGY